MDDQGVLEVAPFTAASLSAAETKVDNALKSILATGLPTNPNTGQPDVRIAVRTAAQQAAAPPADGAFILVLPVGGATTVVPGNNTTTPNTGWTT